MKSSCTASSASSNGNMDPVSSFQPSPLLLLSAWAQVGHGQDAAAAEHLWLDQYLQCLCSGDAAQLWQAHTHAALQRIEQCDSSVRFRASYPSRKLWPCSVQCSCGPSIFKWWLGLGEENILIGVSVMFMLNLRTVYVGKCVTAVVRYRRESPHRKA